MCRASGAFRCRPLRHHKIITMHQHTSNQSRRTFLKSSGQLLIGFSLMGLPLTTISGEAELSGTRAGDNDIDAWIKIDAEGNITVLTGKTELGQGIKTALRQIAAE